MFTVILPAKVAPAINCPASEADRTGERIETGPLATGAELLIWEETERPLELTARTLKARGVATGRVRLEETVRFVFVDSIAQAASVRFVSAAPVTASRRCGNPAVRPACNNRPSGFVRQPRPVADACYMPSAATAARS